jgi:hypothetical protein
MVRLWQKCATGYPTGGGNFDSEYSIAARPYEKDRGHTSFARAWARAIRIVWRMVTDSPVRLSGKRFEIGYRKAAIKRSERRNKEG